jgi:hypothetical protein
LKHLQRRKHELPGCKNCTYLHTAPDNIDSLTADSFLERGCTKQARAQSNNG